VQHARKRRIMGQAFSEGAMRGMERYVVENVEVWMQGIGERVDAARGGWSERVDMGRWNNYLVFGECIVTFTLEYMYNVRLN
jgi:hypothetical protein